MPHPVLQTDVDQLDELRVHGDDVDAERPVGQRGGRLDLARQQIGRHRARGDDAKPAGIGNRRDQVALRHPGHRAAHHRELGAEKRAAARPQPVEHQARRVGACHVARSRLKPIVGDKGGGHPASSSP
jgi:hypothetical protein